MNNRKLTAPRKIIRKGQYWVYILQCNDGTYYTGYTNDLKNRVALHNKGNGAKYLKRRLPVKLVYAKEYRYYKNALRAERRLKKLTREQKSKFVKIYAENTCENSE